jgi:hypothetical protein
LILACGLLAACSKAEHRVAEKLNTYDVAPADGTKAAAPQIAYNYTVSYLLDADKIATVQARQVKLCIDLGLARCRIVKTGTGTNDTDFGATGQASLLIDARIAGEFGRRLDAVVTEVGGAVQGRTTTAEDITKQVIDTGARVRAKQALADRLFGLIQHSGAKVGDLVEAEKAYADTQEQLDAARSLQADLRRRVAMSQIDVDYAARGANGVFAPVRRSAHDAGESFGSSLGALLTFVIVALPWIAVLAALLWVRRRLGWRWPFRTRSPHRSVNVDPPRD